MGQPADLEYDPYAYAIHEDPYPTYRRLRDEAPAYWNERLGFWALSRFQDVQTGLHDWETYSSTGGPALEQSSGSTPPMIISMDPPRQAKLRRLVSKVFTPRRVAMMEPDVRALALFHLRPLLERGTCDVVQEFAAKLPMDVISVMLGVPEADRDMLRGWSDVLLHREENQRDIPEAGRMAAANLARYFMTDIAQRRRQPGAGMISDLIAAEVDGERLDDLEIMGFCFLLVIAGNETTTKMLGNAITLLHRHPDQRAAIVQDPSLLPGAVEEVLRYDNSTQMIARTLAKDIVLYDRPMEAGRKVLLLIGAGNRDERVFDRPDAFDIRRRPEQLLHFGHGIHVCLGASLARLEGRVALEEVHARMPDYVVDEAGLERVHSANVRGFSRVPITFTPTRA